MLHKLPVLWQALPSFNPAALALAGLSIAALVALKRWRPTLPGMLIVVVAGSGAALLLSLPVETIGSRFGTLASGIGYQGLPGLSLARIRELIVPAIAIAMLGGIESLLSAVVADGMTGRRHRSNCELVAQGVANMASALCGGIPVTGTIARTATNVRAGARGPVAGIFHALFLLAFLSVAGGLMAYVPLAVLAAVLAIVAWNMAEKREFASLLRASPGDALVLLAAFLLTVFVDLTAGIGVGIVLGSLLFMHRMAEAMAVESKVRLLDEDIPIGMPRPPPTRAGARSPHRHLPAERRLLLRRGGDRRLGLRPHRPAAGGLHPRRHRRALPRHDRRLHAGPSSTSWSAPAPMSSSPGHGTAWRMPSPIST